MYLRVSQLPHHWQKHLKSYLYTNPDGNLSDQLAVTHFKPKGVRLVFQDDSVMEFNHAFMLHLAGEVGLFTEHCGYYILSEVFLSSIAYR